MGFRLSVCEMAELHYVCECEVEYGRYNKSEIYAAGASAYR